VGLSVAISELDFTLSPFFNRLPCGCAARSDKKRILLFEDSFLTKVDRLMKRIIRFEERKAKDRWIGVRKIFQIEPRLS